MADLKHYVLRLGLFLKFRDIGDSARAERVAHYFSGDTYVNSDTATVDTARRFESEETKLADFIVVVKTKGQLFGDVSGQTYPVAADDTFGLTKVDISTLYFKNAIAGENGTVHILGVRE